MRDNDSGDALIVGFLLGIDQDAKVGSIRHQSLLARLDRVHQALARKRVALEHVETAAVEREIDGIVHPERAQDRTIRGIPHGNFLGVDARLQDGHEGRLILTDGDAIFQFVLEQVTEFAGFAHSGPGFKSLGHRSGVRSRRTTNTKDPTTGTPNRVWTKAWSAASPTPPATAAANPAYHSSHLAAVNSSRYAANHSGTGHSWSAIMNVHFHRCFMRLRWEHCILRQGDHRAARVIRLRYFCH